MIDERNKISGESDSHNYTGAVLRVLKPGAYAKSCLVHGLSVYLSQVILKTLLMALY
jgi:hypothetical protein